MELNRCQLGGLNYCLHFFKTWRNENSDFSYILGYLLRYLEVTKFFLSSGIESMKILTGMPIFQKSLHKISCLDSDNQM